jgi:predicted O-linked N-acetylglucosamine transferase (SPINDLY family)
MMGNSVVDKMDEKTVSPADGERLQKWQSVSDQRTELNRALELQRCGDNEQAAYIYQQILQGDPRHPDALHLSGMLAARQGDYERAIELIRLAIGSYPTSSLFYNNLANVFVHAGRLKEARDAYSKAIEIDPNCFDAYHNLGNVTKRMGNPGEALGYFEKALTIKPESAETYSDMGNVLAERGCFKEAMQCFTDAIARKPDFSKAYNNMGSVLKVQGRYSEAIDYYCQAVEKDPFYAEAFNNIGAAITELGKPHEAVKFFQRALDIKPESELFLVNLYDVRKRTCDWEQLDRLNAKLDALTFQALETARRPLEDPFLNLARHDDPAVNYAVARSWSLDISCLMSAISVDFDFSDRKKDGRPITLGYLSSNFRNHALAHLMVGLFERHDRSRFNVFAYSNGDNDNSDFRKRIEKGCDKFVDIRLQNHLDAAKTIYRDKVDILIDLMGYTKGNRMEIAALRPAPVQVRYMGMAGTTGADFFDYLIADQTVVPLEHQGYYSERLLYLPDCYQINDDQQKKADVNFTRRAVGLPEDAFVFCSFNQPMKLDPIMYAAWMEILDAVPNSVLWLQAGSKACEQNLVKEANRYGIGPDRLVFGSKLSKPEHLSRLQLADLALDTRMVSGAATTSDALRQARSKRPGEAPSKRPP